MIYIILHNDIHDPDFWVCHSDAVAPGLLHDEAGTKVRPWIPRWELLERILLDAAETWPSSAWPELWIYSVFCGFRLPADQSEQLLGDLDVIWGHPSFRTYAEMLSSQKHGLWQLVVTKSRLRAGQISVGTLQHCWVNYGLVGQSLLGRALTGGMILSNQARQACSSFGRISQTCHDRKPARDLLLGQCHHKFKHNSHLLHFHVRLDDPIPILSVLEARRHGRWISPSPIFAQGWEAWEPGKTGVGREGVGRVSHRNNILPMARPAAGEKRSEKRPYG